MSDDKNTALGDQQQASDANQVDPEDQLNERLRALDAESGTAQKGESKRSPAILVAGVVAICGLGLAAYTVSQSGSPERSGLQTGQPDAFQTVGGRAYGDLMVPMSEEPEPRPEPEPEEPQQAEPDPRFADMQRQLEALQAEIAARDAAGQEEEPEIVVEVPVDDPRVSQLAEELEALRRRDEEREAEAVRIAQEHARELQRLQSELDLAQLSGGGGYEYEGNPMLDERARQAEDARRRALEQQERRQSSGMIAFGRSGGGDGSGAAGAAEQRQARLSDNEQFVRDAGRPAQVERAAIIVNPANTVTQGTMIQAILETAINSQLPGAIRGVVSEDVHSYDGTRILIPRGSVVIGRYSEGVQLGQRRALVAWERIIMPDNQSVTISAYGADQIGQSGLTGQVNSNFGQRFGSAALISFLSILPALATENTDDDRANDMADRIGQNLSSSTTSVLSESLRVRPTIRVAQGSRVTIMVDRDLEIF